MAANPFIRHRRPRERRAAYATMGGGAEPAAGGPLHPGQTPGTFSETDAHLRRSYALVELLRREIAVRAALLV